MAWLSKLDTRAARWPMLIRWAYLGLRWYLIAFGAFAMLRLWLDRTGIWSLY